MDIKDISKVLVDQQIDQKTIDSIMRSLTLSEIAANESNNDFIGVIVLLHSHICQKSHILTDSNSCKFMTEEEFGKIDVLSEEFQAYKSMTEDLLIDYQISIEELIDKIKRAAEITDIISSDKCVKFLCGKILSALSKKKQEEQDERW